MDNNIEGRIAEGFQALLPALLQRIDHAVDARSGVTVSGSTDPQADEATWTQVGRDNGQHCPDCRRPLAIWATRDGATRAGCASPDCASHNPPPAELV